MNTILVTGSEGLIGKALCSALERTVINVRRFDLRSNRREPPGDIRNERAVKETIDGCSGVVHLAAVSRVVWGEQDPDTCWETNVEGTQNIIHAAEYLGSPPWVIFSSSREVYGHPERLPVRETDAVAPVNTYGRSKAEAERRLMEARDRGVSVAVLRFSNVYGNCGDHADRVIPAFSRAALTGEDLRVEGAGNTFDFTHLDDTVRGLIYVIQALEEGVSSLPVLHFVTGRPTTLLELAILANREGGERSRIIECPPRSFDVDRFYGDPERAKQVLGWTSTVPLEQGVHRLVRDYQNFIVHSEQDREAP